MNLLDNTPSQPSKFKTKNLVEIIYESRGKYNKNSQIRCKTSMLRSILFDYIDVYILVKETTLVAPQTASAPITANKKAIFKNCAPFINSISRINNLK